MTPAVRAVLWGGVQPLGRTTSGINKQSRQGPQQVGPLGLAGDRQADLVAHGGPHKALHCYTFSHYPWWRGELPSPVSPLLDAPGAFGENLSIDGLSEDDVCIADRWRIGSTLLEVSQGRQPCYKLNLRFGVRDMARRVQDSLRAGWYLRVIEPGALAAGDAIELVHRPHPGFTVARLLAVIRDRDTRADELRPLLALPLTPSWRKLFARRLALREAEDWSARLDGH